MKIYKFRDRMKANKMIKKKKIKKICHRNKKFKSKVKKKDIINMVIRNSEKNKIKIANKR